VIALLCVYGTPVPQNKTNDQVWLIKNGRRESGGVFEVASEG